MATGTSSENQSASDGNTVGSDSDSILGSSTSSCVISLLDRLKSPVAVDIARKRQTKTNHQSESDHVGGVLLQILRALHPVSVCRTSQMRS